MILFSGLLYVFKEDFDMPSLSVYIGHRLCLPQQVIGNESVFPDNRWMPLEW